MLDQKLLEQMVLKAIEQLEKENAIHLPPQKQLCLILPEQWREEYFERLGYLNLPQQYHSNIILCHEMCNDYYYKKLKTLFPGASFSERGKECVNWHKDDFITVFPFPDRSLIAKAALCIADTFESKWIEQCFAQGHKIWMLQEGIAPFTGKEPKAYRLKIEEYLRTLSDFGIEIKAGLSELEPGPLPVAAKRQAPNLKKRIITEADLAGCLAEKKLVLHPGDIVTMLAKEKAGELGIKIVTA